ncbi:hypothetical protein C2S53_008986 [Perilla frutescens var. hirtella]|uniref:Uncharacterized protein n=1 Tax=Perilla frutescens var. hirtella TaxID=608512 RepID=A0AAD4IVY4_PERFH|nr:hypothetical protein C2S53_008986 [Perilla frutescens var. hirtella]
MLELVMSGSGRRIRECPFIAWTDEHLINLFPRCPEFLIPSDNHSEEILGHMEQMDLMDRREPTWNKIIDDPVGKEQVSLASMPSKALSR